MATDLTKTAVLVGRKWDGPQITVTVTQKEIGVEMSLEEFLHSVVLEAGNPTFIFTQAGLEKKLLSAASDVVSGMKEETARVM